MLEELDCCDDEGLGLGGWCGNGAPGDEGRCVTGAWVD